MRSTFQAFDTNKDGKICKEELRVGLEKHAASNEENIQIMALVDCDGNGYIDYSEFLTAAMDKRKVLNKVNLESAFAAFDQDGNGSISADEVRSILGHVESVDKDAFERVIREVDLDGNGEIDLEEFRTMMMKLY